jgi:hypothetical protein
MKTPYYYAIAGIKYILLSVCLLTITQLVLAEGIVLKQCANGGISDPVTHDECHEGWIKGNLNAGKAAYAEGEFVPYRAKLTGLAVGNKYSYSFSWNRLKKGTHALDYIGTFNHSVIDADPCEGIASCSGPPDWEDIPGDSLPFVQVPGQIALYGGTIDKVGPLYIDLDAETRSISVTFTPSQSTVVLAWGGHIASPLDWDGGETASDISGSPYHMSNIALLDSNGVSVAGGAQDAALSAAAVFVPSVINVSKISNAGGSFMFQSWLDGNIPIPPDGEINPWSLDAGQEKTLDALDKGTITITETNLPDGDWRVESITCSKVGEGDVFSYQYGADPVTDTAEFEVDEASTFNCVFENKFFGAPVLHVIKRVIGTAGQCTNAVRDDDTYDTRSIHSGETVKYCYWVTNNGSDDALDVTMIDDRAALAADTPINLSGGTDIGGDGSIKDLAPGDNMTGSLEVTLNLAMNVSATNTATAYGTGKVDGQTYTGEDTAMVTADLESGCNLNASLSTNGCPGVTTLYILKDSQTEVNWCADITWDASAVMDLTGISVALDSPILSSSGTDMTPGSNQVVSVGPDMPNADVTGTLTLTGSEGGLNPISCSGQATVNVVDPGLLLIKMASKDATCGNGDDAHSVEIINGEPVWYCLTVMNTGDVPLENVAIDDWVYDELDLDFGSSVFESGISWTFTSEAYYPGADVTNTAVATSIEPNTGETIDSDQSTATVIVRSADVEVKKSVDPGTIVLCDEGDLREFCSDPDDGDSVYYATYTIEVSNNGPSDATGVMVFDELPEGFSYLSNDGGCQYDDGLRLLSCDLGTLTPKQTVVIEVGGTIDVDDSIFDPPWQRIRNEACASTSPANLDPDHSNNCDDASTTISTGPTRTIGWWRTHPNGIAACLPPAPSIAEIDLGFLVIRDEVSGSDVDATVSTDPDAKGKYKSSLMTAEFRDDADDVPLTKAIMAKGMLNAGTSHWGDGTQRSHIGQARVKTARQLTAAWCNESVFNSEFDDFFLGWDAIRRIMAGEAYLEGAPVTVYYCGNPGDACDKQQDLQKVIDSINHIGSIADMFNNSGDDLPIPLPPEPANPGAPEDDPTDPTD